MKTVQVLDLSGCMFDDVDLNVWLSGAYGLRVLDLSCLHPGISWGITRQPAEVVSRKALVLPQSVVHLHLQGESTKLNLGFAMSYQSV